jgi:hypothetical protein
MTPSVSRRVVITLILGLCTEFILLAVMQGIDPLLTLAAIGAVIVAGTVVLMSLPQASTSPHGGTEDIAALPDYQQHALDQLARLPHCLRLDDGRVIDFLHTTVLQVSHGGDGEEPNPHLVLCQATTPVVSFKTEAALAQYVAVQEAEARRLKAGTLPTGAPLIAPLIQADLS